MMKIKILAYFLLTCSLSYGQMSDYSYKREIRGISEQWHKIILPDDIFGNISPSLSDIRIFGITESNDTVEAPYLVRLTSEKISSQEIAFKTLNTSHNNLGYYFTFEIPKTEPINQIKLNFKQDNFDWKIKLEGSQDLNDWFTITDNYRILSIKNELSNYQFTKLVFPSSKYRYFRILINSKEKPELTFANITQHDVIEGNFRNYPIKKFNTFQNKETKQTEIDIELQHAVHVSQLKINVKDTFDYYRSITIKYLSDSIKTEKGWKYNYSTLSSGILNSIEPNEFKFNGRTVKNLKIIINNQDNQPLNIDSIQVQGYIHELTTRFTEKATYFLVYGNKSATRPNYDLERFTNKVPETLTILELGNVLTINKEVIKTKEPLFKSKTWLWAIMALIILVLGWLTLKMMRKS